MIAAFAGLLGDAVKIPAQFILPFGVYAGLLDRVKIYALHVLMEHDARGVLVAQVANHRRDVRQTGIIASSKATFASDNFESAGSNRADRNRLVKPALFDAGG